MKQENQGWGIRARLLGLLAIVVVLVCVQGGLALFSERETMLQDRKDKVRNLVESAAAVVTDYEHKAASGALSEAQAKALAAAALTAIRYDGKEYFFAYDDKMVYMAHGAKPDKIGKDAHGMTTPDGVNLADLFLKTVRDGAGKGFVSYVWDKPGSTSPQPKISYLAVTPGWHWMIGTGLYLDDLDAAFRQALLALSLRVGVVLALLLGVGYLLVRGVLRQLGGEPAVTVAIVRRIADGQLDVVVPVREGDHDSLLAAVADMQSQLRQLVQRIAGGANAISGMSSQIAGSAEAVAQSSGQQSGAATSMAASVQQMTVSINQIAEHAQDARQLSQASGTLSREGGEVIASAVGEMHRINESVDQAASRIGELAQKTQTISSIMQVIKDIADQTNLLALNAAIEAARAGESGRNGMDAPS